VPTYQYECKNCDSKLTANRGIFEDDPGYQCGTCKKLMTKVYSIGAITFNGSGFYSKDK
jgi:putative FmdB family regulatory protein